MDLNPDAGDAQELQAITSRLVRAGVKIMQYGTEVEISAPTPLPPEIEALAWAWRRPVARAAALCALPMAGATQPNVPAAWRVGVEPGRRYPTCCVETAVVYVLTHAIPGMRLVWGSVQPSRLKGAFAHVWVQLPTSHDADAIVFDGVIQQFAWWEEYRLRWNAQVIQTFTPAEVFAAQ